MLRFSVISVAALAICLSISVASAQGFARCFARATSPEVAALDICQGKNCQTLMPEQIVVAQDSINAFHDAAASSPNSHHLDDLVAIGAPGGGCAFEAEIVRRDSIMRDEGDGTLFFSSIYYCTYGGLDGRGDPYNELFGWADWDLNTVWHGYCAVLAKKVVWPAGFAATQNELPEGVSQAEFAAMDERSMDEARSVYSNHEWVKDLVTWMKFKVVVVGR